MEFDGWVNISKTKSVPNAGMPFIQALNEARKPGGELPDEFRTALDDFGMWAIKHGFENVFLAQERLSDADLKALAVNGEKQRQAQQRIREKLSITTRDVLAISSLVEARNWQSKEAGSVEPTKFENSESVQASYVDWWLRDFQKKTGLVVSFGENGEIQVN